MSEATCPVCGCGPDKVGRHIDCAVALRGEIVGDGSTFTSDDLADDYERHHFGPEKPGCMWLLSYGDMDLCTSPGRKDRQVSTGYIDIDMAPLAVCFDCEFYRRRVRNSL